MHRNSIYFCFHAKDPSQGMVKGKIMDRVATVEESSVDVKKVGVRRIPAEARARKSMRRRCRLVFCGLNQSCHLEIGFRIVVSGYRYVGMSIIPDRRSNQGTIL